MLKMIVNPIKILLQKKILNSLENECKAICIPNLYFLGYFPQNGGYRNKEELILNNGIDTLFLHIDTCIEKEYLKCHSIQEVIRTLKDINYISIEDIQSNLCCTLNELREREKRCDIIMSDYIENNYRARRIFTEPEHPTNEVIAELVNRLLEMLKIKEKVLNFNSYSNLNNQNSLIYPCVYYALGLLFEDEKYFFCRGILDKKISFEEYIELYIRNVCEIID